MQSRRPPSRVHQTGDDPDSQGVASKVSLGPELFGWITKVDVASKTLTIESAIGGTIFPLSTNGTTEIITKAGSSKIDLEKLSNALTKQQAAGKKGLVVKVTHSQGVA